MIDLDRFEKEELPIIKEALSKSHIDVSGKYLLVEACPNLIEAFESAMLALREERERCAKIAEEFEMRINEDERYLHRTQESSYPLFSALDYVKRNIAEEIRKSDNSDLEQRKSDNSDLERSDEGGGNE